MLFLQQNGDFMKIINLKDCQLFKNMDDNQQLLIYNCFKIKEKRYRKNDYIVNVGAKVSSIFIIISGFANVIEDDHLGNRSIIDYILPNQVFGLSYAYSKTNNYPVSLIAKTPIKALIIDIEKIFNPCEIQCSHHSQFIKNALEILSEENISLIDKIEHLSKRTTKDKIIAFLSYISKKSMSNSFDIPFNRQELADYLSVDRSALSTELSKLRCSGLIEFNKNHFILHFDQNNTHS